MNSSIIKTICFATVMFFANYILNASVLDSLRIEKANGKNFVIHKVNKGQTLFGTLRKYGTSLAEYKAANPNADVDIQIGQILRIPYNKPLKEIVKTKPKVDEIVVDKKTKVVENKDEEIKSNSNLTQTYTKAKTFKVEPGMTLFSVAKRNGTTVAELKRLNKMKDDVIQSGEILIVREGDIVKEKAAPKEVVAAKSSTENTVIIKERPVFHDESNATSYKKVPEKEVIVIQKEKPIEVIKKEIPVKTDPIKKVEPQIEATKPKVEETPKNNTDSSKIKTDVKNDSQMPMPKNDDDAERVIKVEEGIAELIAVESKSGKYLALHKTAPIGTLIQVKNETNGASVWVKVIGRLPEVDQNENVVIKLSPKAMDRVSPVDKKFRAKLNYSF
jgi:LysM repeat protein